MVVHRSRRWGETSEVQRQSARPLAAAGSNRLLGPVWHVHPRSHRHMTDIFRCVCATASGLTSSLCCAARAPNPGRPTLSHPGDSQLMRTCNPRSSTHFARAPRLGCQAQRSPPNHAKMCHEWQACPGTLRAGASSCCQTGRQGARTWQASCRAARRCGTLVSGRTR